MKQKLAIIHKTVWSMNMNADQLKRFVGRIMKRNVLCLQNLCNGICVAFEGGITLFLFDGKGGAIFANRTPRPSQKQQIVAIKLANI